MILIKSAHLIYEPKQEDLISLSPFSFTKFQISKPPIKPLSPSISPFPPVGGRFSPSCRVSLFLSAVNHHPPLLSLSPSSSCAAATAASLPPSAGLVGSYLSLHHSPLSLSSKFPIGSPSFSLGRWPFLPPAPAESSQSPVFSSPFSLTSAAHRRQGQRHRDCRCCRRLRRGTAVPFFSLSSSISPPPPPTAALRHHCRCCLLSPSASPSLKQRRCGPLYLGHAEPVPRSTSAALAALSLSVTIRRRPSLVRCHPAARVCRRERAVSPWWSSNDVVSHL